MKRILWLDNDRAYTVFSVSFLQEKGYEVTVVETAAEAQQLLGRERYDLIIIDVMVPTKTPEEEQRYKPDETERGYRTGLVFYREHKREFEQKRTGVLVLTVRLDKTIKEEFSKAGLPDESFSTKYELQDIDDFIQKVDSILNSRAEIK